MCRYDSRTGCVMRQYGSHTADVPQSSHVRSLAVPRSYRGHHARVMCRYEGHTSNERLIGVFLRRRKSGRKVSTHRKLTTSSYTNLQVKLSILGVRTLICGTVRAGNVSTDLAVPGRRNRTHRGHHLARAHLQVHESDEHLGVADVAGRGLLRGRGHLSPFYNKRGDFATPILVWPPLWPPSRCWTSRTVKETRSLGRGCLRGGWSHPGGSTRRGSHRGRRMT